MTWIVIAAAIAFLFVYWKLAEIAAHAHKNTEVLEAILQRVEDQIDLWEEDTREEREDRDYKKFLDGIQEERKLGRGNVT
jgi:F0F1-type ATP synthase membrane subunit a